MAIPEILTRSSGSYELRDAPPGESTGPTLYGHAAVFNQWARIDSIAEGTFMERVAPGAFRKTIAEDRSKIRVLFQHGEDPEVGNRPIAALRTLAEDSAGLVYEAALLDGVPPLIVAGLRAKLYGASFRFRVSDEEMNNRAKASDHNPDGLPERTIRAAQVFEFGPVTFGAYVGASADLRSVDQWLRDPARLRQLAGER